MNSYKEIYRCNRCAFCQELCPTYQATKDESQVARARIHLSKIFLESQGQTELALREKIGDCLLCGSCTATCPAGVKTADLMRAVRHDFFKKKGFPLFWKLVYRGGLSHRERQNRVSFLMRLYKRSGLRNFLYLESLEKAAKTLQYYDSFLPDKLTSPATTSLAKIITRSTKPKFKVSYFIGCASNIFWPQVPLAAVDYLKSQNIEITIPKIKCCGEAHRGAGDLKEAQRLARHNLKILSKENSDYIISDCSTCVHSLHSYGDFFEKDDAIQENISILKAKFQELNSFIVNILGLPQGNLREIKGKISYHDSCHALHGLKIKNEPREILKAIPGLEFIEMAKANSCCGSAGSYAFSHPENSQKILALKLERIKATKANLLATSCPSCALQLMAAIKRAKLGIKVYHPVELLQQSLGL